MFRFLGVSFATLVRLFCLQKSLLLENLALRQQLSVLKRRHPHPRLQLLDRLFWLIVRRCWSGWKQALLVVTLETVVRWHRAGFRRDLLDHIIAINERRLKRVLGAYVSPITTKTARIWDSGREHRTAEVAPCPLVACTLMSAWEGCMIHALTSETQRRTPSL